MIENPFEIIDQRLQKIEAAIAELKELIVNPDKIQVIEEDRNFSVSALAEYLGCSKITIFKYKKDGVFPFYQAGRTIFFKKSEVDEALSMNKPKKRRYGQ
jgi:excisionase family DNA binding protein